MRAQTDRSGNIGSYNKLGKGAQLIIGRLSPEDREEFKKILIELEAKFQKTVVGTDETVIIPQVKAIVQSITEKAAAEICHRQSLEHDGLNHELSSLKVTLNDLREQCNKVFAKVVQNFDGVQNRLAALQELNERLQLDTRKTLVCCEEILMQIRWGNEHIEELATLVKENSKGIAKIGDKVEVIDDKVETLKEIVLSFLRFAEKQHEEYQSARAVMKQRYKELSSPPPGLDAQTIADMHEWLQELSGKSVEEIEKSIDEKSSELTQKIEEINKNLEGIENLVARYGEAQKVGQERLEKQISQKAKEILQGEMELYSLTLDTKEEVKGLHRAIDDLIKRVEDSSREVEDAKDTKAKLEETGANPEEVKRLQKEIDGKSLMIDTLSETIAILRNNGKQVFHNESCPFCRVEEERPTLGTQCECLVCGNIFTIGEPIDPNMSDISDERVQEDARQLENHRQEKRRKNECDGEDWRTRHTAVLEKVSENKYRMKLPSRGGDDGILIIPSETKYPEPGGEAVKQIDFCQPNTDDEEGREQLLKVKKLFLEGGIKIGEFHDVVPFSEIGKGLEKVMKWDGNGFIEDEGTLKKIKG